MNKTRIKEQAELITDYVSERSLLSLMINNPDICYDVFSEISSDDFYNYGNRNLAELLQSLVGDDSIKGLTKINPYMLAVMAEKQDMLEDIGGREYINALSNMDVPIQNLRFFLDNLKFCTVRRKMYYKGINIIENAIDPDTNDMTEYLAKNEQEVLEVATDAVYGDGVVNLTEGIGDIIEYRANHASDIIGIPTLWDEFDKQTGGLEGGNLYIYAARSKNFKSGVMLNIANNIAVEQKTPILYLDTELNKRVQINRLLSIVSGVPERRIKTGNFVHFPEQKRALDEAKEKLQETQIFHAYIPGFTTEQIQYIIRKYTNRNNIGLVIFDYIKIPRDTDSKFQQRRHLLGELTMSLKDIAGKINIPVFAPAQFNRGAITSEEPNESHIAESDEILQNADYTFFGWWKSEERIEEEDGELGNYMIKSGPCRFDCEYRAHFKIGNDLRMHEVYGEDG